MKNSIPISRIVRLVSNAVRYSAGGFSKEEIRQLIAELLQLAAELAESLAEEERELERRES